MVQSVPEFDSTKRSSHGKMCGLLSNCGVTLFNGILEYMLSDMFLL